MVKGVDEPDDQLVVGVRGQGVVVEEARGDGLGILAHQPRDLVLFNRVARDGVAPGQARQVLTEAVTGDESVPVGRAPVLGIDVEVGRLIVPTAHVGAGSRLARAHPEGLEQPIVVDVQEQPLLLLELREHRSFAQLHRSVGKLLQRGIAAGDGAFAYAIRTAGTWQAHSRCATVSNEATSRVHDDSLLDDDPERPDHRILNGTDRSKGFEPREEGLAMPRTPSGNFTA